MATLNDSQFMCFSDFIVYNVNGTNILLGSTQNVPNDFKGMLRVFADAIRGLGDNINITYGGDTFSLSDILSNLGPINIVWTDLGIATGTFEPGSVPEIRFDANSMRSNAFGPNRSLIEEFFITALHEFVHANHYARWLASGALGAYVPQPHLGEPAGESYDYPEAISALLAAMQTHPQTTPTDPCP